MELYGYELRISEGNETADGYVEMIHGTQYKIKMVNNNDMRCDVEVHIDGKHIGTWRIDEESTITVERPVHDAGKFTFYKLGTPEAKMVELENNEMLGLVTAIFKPEKIQEFIDVAESKRLVEFEEQCACRIEMAGGTGLSGKSGQRFGTVEALEYDLEKQVTIHLRLIAAKEEPRPLRIIIKSTPIPPFRD